MGASSCKESAVSSLKRAAPDDHTVAPMTVTDAKEINPSKRARTQISGQGGDESQEDGEDPDNPLARSLVEQFEKWLLKHGGQERGKQERGDEGREEDSDDDGEEGSRDGGEDGDEEDDDGGDVAVPTRGFVGDLVDYRQNSMDSDNGQRLENLMCIETSRISKDHRQALWRLWFLRMCVQLLRESEEPYFSATGDARKEREERRKRHACLILNGIVDGLWAIRRQRALVFYQFLAGERFHFGSP